MSNQEAAARQVARKVERNRPENDEFTEMESKLMALLDRIEVEEDHTLASQRFEIGEEAGYTVHVTGERVSSFVN